MNARQAKRIVLWMNGSYMVAADHYGLSDEDAERLSEEDLRRLNNAQTEIGLEMMRRSGLPEHTTPDNILSLVMGEPGKEDAPA